MYSSKPTSSMYPGDEVTKTTIYFFLRMPSDNDPGGYTVTKKPALPIGDFRITEFNWPDMTLWFIDDDKFTADEREGARIAALKKGSIK